MPIHTKWRPFTNEVVELAPEKPGVYELGTAKSDVVVYIGSSESSIRSRLLSHKKMKRFMRVSHFRFRVTTPRDARKAEDKLCTDFVKQNKGRLPRLQERRPPKSKPSFFLDFTQPP